MTTMAVTITPGSDTMQTALDQIRHAQVECDRCEMALEAARADLHERIVRNVDEGSVSALDVSRVLGISRQAVYEKLKKARA